VPPAVEVVVVLELLVLVLDTFEVVEVFKVVADVLLELPEPELEPAAKVELMGPTLMLE